MVDGLHTQGLPKQNLPGVGRSRISDAARGVILPGRGLITFTVEGYTDFVNDNWLFMLAQQSPPKAPTI